MAYGDYYVREMMRILHENCYVALMGVIIILLYNYYTHTFDFFREKGVTFLPPRLFVGNMAERLLLKISFHDFVISLYNQFDGLPYGGFFEGRRPVLLLRDVELIKLVLIKDFDHFVDRNTISQGRTNYLGRMLLTLEGQEWKSVRSILTPTFSSAKLKNMTPIISNCAEQLVKILQNRKDGDYEIEAKKFMGRYTLDIIGSCAFGIECDSLKDADSDFVTTAQKFNDMSILKRVFLLFAIFFMPIIFKFFTIDFLNTESTDKLIEILKGAKKLRETSEKNRRNDFLQLLLDAAKNELEESSKDPHKKISLDEATVDAQIVLFLIAGFETSSTVLSFAIYALTKYPEIQKKVRDEILNVNSKFGSLTYEALSELTYMDMVISETLRLYPPVARVDRTCTKAYQFPSTGLKLQPKDVVAIPISGIHMDPLYYPRPTEFNPERFSPEEKKNRPTQAFLPFGEGPRNCIGVRFALLSIKMALSHLLLNFELTSNDKTQIKVKFSKKGPLLNAQDGLWVDVKPFKVHENILG